MPTVIGEDYLKDEIVNYRNKRKNGTNDRWIMDKNNRKTKK